RGHFRFNFAALLFLALDVDVPADELAGQPNVLAFLADGQRELRILDDHFQLVIFGIGNLDARDLGRAQRFLLEGHGFFAVRDDVDFLAAQFADDGLYAHALHADARTHRVDVFVAAENGDLGALARFAGGGADLHRAVVNFRHFHFKQALHQS